MKKNTYHSKSFCVLPWLHRFTNIEGQIQVCCSSEEYDNNIRDNSGGKMTAPSANNNEEIMNSNFMKNLRIQMIQGEWPTICQRCKITEEIGGVSRRQSENQHFQEDVSHLISSTQQDGTIPVNIRSVDFRLGNLCNLACRMCSPRSSSRWARERDTQELIKTITSPPNLETSDLGKWFQTKEIFTEFGKVIPTLKHLHFAGGEPLIIPEMPRFLDRCIKRGYAKNITLTYNTNLTRIPNELKKLWPYFKEVKLWASIDGFGKINDFIRFGSNWSLINKNLMDLDRNHLKYGVSEVQIQCTVQIYNIFRLNELYEYLAESFTFITPLPQLIELHFPDYFRIQALPENLKTEARDIMKLILIKSETRLNNGKIHQKYLHLLDSLKGTIEFLNLEDYSVRIPTFIERTEILDKVRGQNFRSLVPELESLYEPN